MHIDNDTTGFEQAYTKLMRFKSFRPFCSTWFAVKIDGEWGCYDTVGKVTRVMRSAESVCPSIIYGQESGKAYATAQFRKAIRGVK